MKRAFNQWFGLAFMASTLVSCVSKSPSVDSPASPATKPAPGSNNGGKPGAGSPDGGTPNSGGATISLTAKIAANVISNALPSGTAKTGLTYSFSSDKTSSSLTDNLSLNSATTISLKTMSGLTGGQTAILKFQVLSGAQAKLCFQQTKTLPSNGPASLEFVIGDKIDCANGGGGGTNPAPPGGGGGTNPAPPGGGGGTNPAPPGGGGGNNGGGGDTDVDIQIQAQLGKTGWLGDKDVGNSAWSIDG